MALAWAEDRALLRSTPSADPGAKTGAKAGPEWPALLPTPHCNVGKPRLRDWHECVKPPRHDAAAPCQDDGQPSALGGSTGLPNGNPSSRIRYFAPPAAARRQGMRSRSEPPLALSELFGCGEAAVGIRGRIPVGILDSDLVANSVVCDGRIVT